MQMVYSVTRYRDFTKTFFSFKISQIYAHKKNLPAAIFTKPNKCSTAVGAALFTEFHPIRAKNTESTDKNHLHPYVNNGFYRAGVHETHSYLISF
jgi:hypothetical protein